MTAQSLPTPSASARPRPGTGERATSAAGGWIIVGVDGTPAGTAALRWAVQLGRRERCPLEVVATWVNPTACAAHQVPGHVNEQRERAARVAEAAAALARRELPADLPVTTAVLMGRPGDVLAERARGARFLVFGEPLARGPGSDG